jgi:nicotinamidase-related amidase
MADLDAEGHSGIFDGHLQPGRTPAMIVIDVCNAYLLAEAPLYAPAFVEALPVIARLVDAARAAGIVVIHTRVSYQRGGANGGLFYRKVPALSVFDEGSSLADFPDSVAPKPNELVVTKQYASAFFGTSLAATLNAARIDSVILCGFSTSGCVRATATDAIQLGFAPFIVREACADRHAAIQASNLFDLQSKYAEVVGIDEIDQLFARH